MSETELRELCNDWQRRLRVQDWDVELVFMDRFNMGEMEGECIHHLRQKNARIRLLAEDERQKSAVGTQDTETRLVHELIHLLIAPFEPEDVESPQYVAMEQAVNSLALALVGLKRAGGILESALRREQGSQRGDDEPEEFIQVRREVAEELLEGIREADYTLKTVSTPEQHVEARQKGTLPVWSVLESALRKAEHRAWGEETAICVTCAAEIPISESFSCVDGASRCRSCYATWSRWGKTYQRHEHEQIQQIGIPPAPSSTLCAYCEKPLERGFVARVLLDDGRQAHVECYLGRSAATFECARCHRILPVLQQKGSVWAEDGNTRLGISCRECKDAEPPICICSGRGPVNPSCAIHAREAGEDSGWYTCVGCGEPLSAAREGYIYDRAEPWHVRCKRAAERVPLQEGN